MTISEIKRNSKTKLSGYYIKCASCTLLYFIVVLVLTYIQNFITNHINNSIISTIIEALFLILSLILRLWINCKCYKINRCKNKINYWFYKFKYNKWCKIYKNITTSSFKNINTINFNYIIWFLFNRKYCSIYK